MFDLFFQNLAIFITVGMKNLTQKLIREAQSPPTRCVSTQPPEVFEYDPAYKQKVNFDTVCLKRLQRVSG